MNTLILCDLDDLHLGVEFIGNFSICTSADMNATNERQINSLCNLQRFSNVVFPESYGFLSDVTSESGNDLKDGSTHQISGQKLDNGDLLLHAFG